MKRKKDPKKVAAGRKGGRLSGANFKRNKDLAIMAGRKSAWSRNQKKLKDYPIGLIDPDDGHEVPFPEEGVRREI